MQEEIDNPHLWIDAILKGEASIDSKYAIEDVLLVMQSYNKKIEFYKELKRKRVAAIDEQIVALEDKLEVLQDAVTNCMLANKEKNLDFPGIGKVTVRKSKASWQISDDDKLYKFLEEMDLLDGLVENSWKFKKKELNKILDQLSENNNIPNSVHKDEDKSAISITYHKETKNDEHDSSRVNIRASTNFNNTDYDKLII